MQKKKLRHNADSLQPFANSVHCGAESILFKPKDWEYGYKNINSLYNFKKVIKK